MVPVLFGSISVLAQTPSPKAFSESLGYQPHNFSPIKSKSKKKDSEPPPATASSPVVQGKPLTIPVSVINSSDKPVSDLKDSEFTVFMDGKEIVVSKVEKQTERLSFIFLVDTSPSTSFSIKDIQAVVTSVVRELSPGDTVTIISFNMKTKILADSTTNPEKIKKAIDKLGHFGDGTSLYEAVRYAFGNVASRMTGRTALILLTDGVDTTSVFGAEYSLLYAEKGDMMVFPVFFDTLQDAGMVARKNDIFSGLGSIRSRIPPPPNGAILSEDDYARAKMYLNDLALISGGRAFKASDLGKKSGPGIREGLKSTYLLTVAPGSGTAEQRREIKVRVGRPNLLVMTRGTYIPEEDKGR